MKVRPKRIVLDVLATLRGRPAPVRLLVASTALFGIDANATRVAITRLLGTGQIERDERGAYRTAAAVVPTIERFSTWRSIERHSRAWDGSWLATTPDACRDSRTSWAMATRAMGYAGLREFSPGLWLRPGNFAGGLGAMREALRTFGMCRCCPVFGIRDFEDTDQARARTLWDSEDLPSTYRRLNAQLEESAARLESKAPEEALAECFHLGGTAIRTLVLDPMLPDAIVPTAARDQLLATTIEYDQLGHRLWAPFAASHGVELDAPAVGREPWRDASRDFGYEEQAQQAGEAL